MENELSAKEIEYLINLEKNYEGFKQFKYPSLGGKLIIDLTSKDRNEDFFLDISRSRIVISKNTFQNRARKTITLLRLDINSAPHRNPDGKFLSGTHLHIFKEGYADKFAYELPKEFSDCKNAIDFLYRFMDYCNIKNKPAIKGDLFT